MTVVEEGNVGPGQVFKKKEPAPAPLRQQKTQPSSRPSQGELTAAQDSFEEDEHPFDDEEEEDEEEDEVAELPELTEEQEAES